MKFDIDEVLGLVLGAILIGVCVGMPVGLWMAGNGSDGTYSVFGKQYACHRI